MAILKGQEAHELVGFPESHCVAFQNVANYARCIIMNRAVGDACKMLIEESYASKGTKPEQMHDANPTVVDGLTSVMAMTDPLMAKNAKRLGYRAAITGDMREFISTVVAPKYAPVFNPGWMNELVWGSNKRAESIKAALAANFQRRQAQGK